MKGYYLEQIHTWEKNKKHYTFFFFKLYFTVGSHSPIHTLMGGSCQFQFFF